MFETIYKSIEEMGDVFGLGCSLAVIFGGLVPYVPQYLKIRRTLNSDGFSTYVCLTLLLANIMRINFWFGHRFETPLLLQSFVMIAGMLAMVEICVRVKDKDPIYSKPRRFFPFGKASTSSESTPIYSVSSSSSSSSSASNYARPDYRSGSQHDQDRHKLQRTVAGSTGDSSRRLDQQQGGNLDAVSFSQQTLYDANYGDESFSLNVRYFKRPPSYKFLDSRDFWLWDDFLSYVEFLALFSFVFGLVTYIFVESQMYIELVGFLALFTESMLGIPQLMRNYSKRSTRGMSVSMVVMWLSGDVFKTLYFVIRETPPQFWICGGIQVVIDLLILMQALLYCKSYSLPATEFA